jgi:hypothetical protein
VPARPLFIGRDGWVRSRAWTWVFSSKLNTTARSGGFRYRPTTSMSLASKSGSLEILKPSTRHGLRPCFRQIRATVSLPIPCRSPIVRVLQCVESSSGRTWSVSCTTASSTCAATHDRRPRPPAIRPTPVTPSASNRRRHARTEFDAAFTWRAVS